MAIASQKQINSLELFQKRMELMIGARLRLDDRIKKAVSVQDKIRSKTKFWNGAEEVKKWREKRQS